MLNSCLSLDTLVSKPLNVEISFAKDIKITLSFTYLGTAGHDSRVLDQNWTALVDGVMRSLDRGI